jgi:COP9 signalosome complex subunit 4
MEHNLLSASRVYSNISFSGLGLLLSLTPAAGEAMARTMIQQGRLRASIDQVDGLITFEASADDHEGAISNVAAAATAQAQAGGEGVADESEDGGAEAPATRRWDANLRKTSQLVEDLAARCGQLIAGQA